MFSQTSGMGFSVAIKTVNIVVEGCILACCEAKGFVNDLVTLVTYGH